MKIVLSHNNYQQSFIDDTFGVSPNLSGWRAKNLGANNAANEKDEWGRILGREEESKLPFGALL